ncbi:MAG: hypothetical protein Q4F67_17465 [Propionibacteriaceae bacterium]|nr:hypothetical protein [Propionibacteriaceae bacterium]
MLLIPPLVRGTDGPVLGQDLPVRQVLAGVGGPPLRHDVGHLRDPGTDDERQPGLLQQAVENPGSRNPSR